MRQERTERRNKRALDAKCRRHKPYVKLNKVVVVCGAAIDVLMVCPMCGKRKVNFRNG